MIYNNTNSNSVGPDHKPIYENWIKSLDAYKTYIKKYGSFPKGQEMQNLSQGYFVCYCKNKSYNSRAL